MFKILSYLLLIFLSAQCFAQIEDSRPLITTVGTAIVYAAPDQIVFSYELSETKDNASAARAALTEESKKVLNILASHKISSKHIQTKFMNIDIVYPDRRGNLIGPRKIMASQIVEVCVIDMNRYEGLVDALIESGVETIQGPLFRNTNIKNYKDKARVKAIVAAKKKAIIYAEALNQSIGNAYTIEENFMPQRNNNQGGYISSVENLGASADDDWSFAAGQLKVSASVIVSFHLMDR